MSVFSGQSASADVRALTKVAVLAFSLDDFFRVAAAFPRIYLNLGAVLSQRLAQSDRRVGIGRESLIVLIDDHAAQPLAAYAIAASLAWHTQRLVPFVLFDREVPSELASLVAQSPRLVGAGAYVEVLNCDGSPTNALLAYLDRRDDDRCVVFAAPPGTVLPLVHRRVRILPTPDDALIQIESSPQVDAWSGLPEHNEAGGVRVLAAPTRADMVALHHGLLPTTTATGKAFGRLSRDLAGLQVGVALGAGSAKGYAHLGVLRALAQSNIPIDYLAGVSIGAVVAGLTAAGYDPATSEKLLGGVGRATFRPTVSTKALMSSSRVRRAMQTVWGETRLEELDTPLTIVATDVLLGQEVLLRRGLLWAAVLASIAIPGIYPPQHIGGHVLVDGGLVNPVPSNVVASMGADVVIAVKLADRPPPRGVDAEAEPTHGQVPTAAQTMMRSIEIMQAGIREASASTATVVIEPRFERVSGFGLRDFSKGSRFVDLGEAAAEEAIAELADALPWLRAT